MILPDQFEQVRPLFEALRKPTKPRTHDLYNVFCAVLYLLENDIPWRLLPGRRQQFPFPPHRTVHEYFSQWTAGAHLATALNTLGLVEATAKLTERLERNVKYARPHLNEWRTA